jgi:hypothetical protein
MATESGKLEDVMTMQRFKDASRTRLPYWEALETVHHRPIVSIRCRRKHNKQQANIKPSHSRLFVPTNSREIYSRQLESADRMLPNHD